MARIVATLFLAAALAACGNKSKPADNPSGVRCTTGEYFVPGCSDEPGITAGCYARCPFGAACAPGHTCAKVTVMPACAMADSDVACEACGEELELCLPDGM